MSSFVSPLWPSNASITVPATINLDEPNAVLRARTQPLGALAVHIDCARLTCQRTLGVGHVVSQLLLLHRTGAHVWLRNVNEPLRRCLRLVCLTPLFQFEEAR